MVTCEKYRSIEDNGTSYYTRPAGNCRDCVYFSPKNCGLHASAIPKGEDSAFFAIKD
jgi:hypothetical protein